MKVKMMVTQLREAIAGAEEALDDMPGSMWRTHKAVIALVAAAKEILPTFGGAPMEARTAPPPSTGEHRCHAHQRAAVAHIDLQVTWTPRGCVSGTKAAACEDCIAVALSLIGVSASLIRPLTDEEEAERVSVIRETSIEQMHISVTSAKPLYDDFARSLMSSECKGKTVESFEWEPEGKYWVMTFTDESEVCVRTMAELTHEGWT